MSANLDNLTGKCDYCLGGFAGDGIAFFIAHLRDEGRL